MGIKSFFKKFRPEKKKEVKKITLKELPKELEDLTIQDKQKKQELKQNINRQIQKFLSDLKEQIKILESITLEKKRESPELKKVVLENLAFYITHLKSLVRNFKESENLPSNEYLSRINLIIQSHNKQSRPSFEKATILIGDELAKARESIWKLFNEITRLSSEYQSSKPDLAPIKDLLEKLKHEKHNEQSLHEVDEKLNIKLEESKTELVLAEKELHIFKESSEYKLFLEKKQEEENKKEQLNKSLYEIQSQVDFKELAKYAHGHEKKSKIIADYRNNFAEGLKKDSSLEIIQIVKESSGKDIRMLKEIVVQLKKPTDKPTDKLFKQEKKIKREKEEISGTQKDIEDNLKRIEKLKEKQNAFLTDINEQATILGLDLVTNPKP